MEILTKEEVLKELKKHVIFGEGRILFKILDYSHNKLAPEDIAYRVFYYDLLGKRCKVTYYPTTAGFQWN